MLTCSDSRSEQILNCAEELIRKRGFNGFSYAHIASETGLSKPSVHHYFPKKSDLGLRLIARFGEREFEVLAEIDARYSSCLVRLREYARLYEASLHEDLMCLCGMLAAEHETLPLDMQAAVREFFDRHELWLEGLLRAGKAAGEIEYHGEASDNAGLILSLLQGALMLGKTMGTSNRLSSATSHLIECYRSKSSSAAASAPS